MMHVNRFKHFSRLVVRDFGSTRYFSQKMLEEGEDLSIRCSPGGPKYKIQLNVVFDAYDCLRLKSLIV